MFPLKLDSYGSTDRLRNFRIANLGRYAETEVAGDGYGLWKTEREHNACIRKLPDRNLVMKVVGRVGGAGGSERCGYDG